MSLKHACCMAAVITFCDQSLCGCCSSGSISELLKILASGSKLGVWLCCRWGASQTLQTRWCCLPTEGASPWSIYVRRSTSPWLATSHMRLCGAGPPSTILKGELQPVGWCMLMSVQLHGRE